MGNAVRAASPQGDVSVIPYPEDSPKHTASVEGPGSIETIHNKAHDVFPVPFDGAKLVINKGLSPNFQVNHSITLGKDDQGGYRFGVTYVGHKKVSETESYPVLLGEVQPNGNMQAQIIDRIYPSMFVRYVAQAQHNRMMGQQFTAEMKLPSWQSSLAVINPDISRGQTMASVDILRRLTNRIALGSMFFYQRSAQLPAEQDGVWVLGARYMTDYWQLAATVRPWQLGFHTSFHLQANENLQFAAEFESSVQTQSNTTTLGYKYDIGKGNVTFKAQIDSNWNIASSLEKKIAPFTFTLCAMGNQVKSKYAFGIGFMIG